MNSMRAPDVPSASDASNPLKKPRRYSLRTGLRYASTEAEVARGTALICGESADETET
jgi:hypothetical protein